MQKHEFLLERNALQSRLVNLSKMIKSYQDKYNQWSHTHTQSAYHLVSNTVADVCISKYDKPIPFFDDTPENEFEHQLAVLERRLKVIQRISLEWQELNVFMEQQKCE